MYKKLSPKERQVILLIADGFSDKEIATRMQCSIHSIRTSVDKIAHKLGTRNRTHSVIVYFKNNIELLASVSITRDAYR